MKLYKANEINLKTDMWFIRADLDNWLVQHILSKLSEESIGQLNNLLVENLNCIASQGIQRFNLRKRYYVKDDEVLPYSYLSSAERVFAVATVADYCKHPVYLSHDFWSLTLGTREKFRLLFGASEYVNFVAIRMDDDSRLRELNAFIKRGGAC